MICNNCGSVMVYSVLSGQYVCLNTLLHTSADRNGGTDND
jgi:transposase